MFKQFAIARFMIGFIVFILAYMVASMSYDVFFHFLTAGMFVLSLWVMYEAQLGHKEELAKCELACEEKVREVQELLAAKEAELNALMLMIGLRGDVERNED